MLFTKIFPQIFDSSLAQNYELRHMFMDLLLLADWDGVVDMTYDAISRRTNVPIDKVVAFIGELMEPDEHSRSRKLNGQRLELIDSRRTWGWRIVNYTEYREMRDEETRRKRNANKVRAWRERQRSEGKPNRIDPVTRVTNVTAGGQNGENGARTDGKVCDVTGVTERAESDPDLPSKAAEQPVTDVTDCNQALPVVAHEEGEADSKSSNRGVGNGQGRSKEQLLALKAEDELLVEISRLFGLKEGGGNGGIWRNRMRICGLGGKRLGIKGLRNAVEDYRVKTPEQRSQIGNKGAWLTDRFNRCMSEIYSAQSVKGKE